MIVSLSAVAPTNICSADCWPLLDEAVPPVVRAAGPFAFELSGDWRAATLAWEELGCPYDAGLARLGGDVPAVGKAGAQIAARMCISPKTGNVVRSSGSQRLQQRIPLIEYRIRGAPNAGRSDR